MANRPDGGPAGGESSTTRWLGPLGRWIDRWLNAPSGADPLYLSNRTFAQKLRLWTFVAIPCIGVVVVVYLGLTGQFASSAPSTPPATLTPAQVAARSLPNLNNIKIESNRDLEVVDAHLVHNAGTMIEGSVRNNTARPIAAAEVVFDLTDSSGSQLGGVSTRLEHLEPHKATPFQIRIQQAKAAFALVREVHAQ